jgi:hypothetical protein
VTGEDDIARFDSRQYTKIQNTPSLGACSTDVRLDTSKNGLKHVYTNPQEIYWKTYFLENVHLKLFTTFTIKVFVSNKHIAVKWHLLSKIAL